MGRRRGGGFGAGRFGAAVGACFGGGGILALESGGRAAVSTLADLALLLAAVFVEVAVDFSAALESGGRPAVSALANLAWRQIFWRFGEWWAGSSFGVGRFWRWCCWLF